ncbi:MAG: Phosphonate-transporting ATPase [Bacillales bacterium]|jgi:polar amino acid transport system ATP-binding protein|nr:Phosphonate-transporting ATPase [Bacillales bacterium]
MVLEVKGLDKYFKNNKVLQNISFSLERGKITAILGSSGAGKTTLLRCINALETCDRGSIYVDGAALCKEDNEKVEYAKGESLKSIRKNLGMVFQNFNLFPHKSILENIIESPVNVYKIPRAEAEKKAFELMKLLGIQDKANNYPYQLSGGQKQRVAIARACALNPGVMCFDEPTSALDPELTENIANIMKMLASENMAILVITHDMNFAKRVADRIIFLDAGEIVQEDDTEVFFTNPKNERVKKFLMNS